MKYEAVIGLEVHVQLKTNTKIWCGCSLNFGQEPNTQVCEVCLGMPGTLPVMNKKVLEYAVKIALALDCGIANFSKMDRKNYYYPDLPKNYQISQYDLPVSFDGGIMINIEGESKRIGVTRAHIEEDAGKLVHDDFLDRSKVDYNRTGTPLIEIVSEPDMRTPEEAYEYLKNLKAILEYLDVSDCNMEEGSLRCDANISVRPVGQEKFGTKAEIKNLNSFRNVQKALEYEIERQIDLVEDGGEVVQETRLFDADKEITLSMRGKESAHDYRYFPDPDLVPFVLEDEDIKKIGETIPELPQAKAKRFISEFGLSEYDASVLTADKKMALYFEEAQKEGADAKKCANWIMGDIAAYIKDKGISIAELKITPKMLGELLKLIDNGTISGKIAKEVFAEMTVSGKNAEEVVKEKGLVQISDSSELEEIAKKVVEANPKSVEDFKNGKQKALGALVGGIMKETKGKANPKLANEILRKLLT